MSERNLEDETTASSLELLARYRKLCEAAGAAGVGGTGLPRAVREELSRVEAELQTRLWLAKAEAGDRPARKLAARQASSLFSEPEGRTAKVTGNGSGPAPLAAGAVVYCDGACIGNPGPGGYGALVRVPGHPEKTLSAGKARTTNNEMELTAALTGLKTAIALGAREVTVVSDSEYLVKGMNGWVRGWLRNGWKTKTGDPVKNRALWEELNGLCQGRSVTWSWVRGHNGQRENELCDRLAVAAAEEAARCKRRTE